MHRSQVIRKYSSNSFSPKVKMEMGGGGIEKLRKNYINFDVRLNRLSLSPSLQSLRIFISFIPKIIRNSFFFLSLFTYVVVVAGTFFLLRVRLSWTQNVYDLKLFRITENKIYRQWKTECGTKLKKKKIKHNYCVKAKRRRWNKKWNGLPRTFWRKSTNVYRFKWWAIVRMNEI